ncbi:MAG: triphosphoribosyl-dephospho-CoA synthase [Gammaproteobacteria bacterium]
MISRQTLIDAYRFACETELQAFKPGNVSVYSEGHDMSVEDFRVSATVSAEPLSDPAYSLGERIYYAVKATRDAVGCNTNLGIVLLCAPLIEAAETLRKEDSLRSALARVLDRASVRDAQWVYRAISLASPGGLGEADEQDVRKKPTVTLGRAMAMAADKDRIAYQYRTSYKDIFDFAIFRYNWALNRWGEHKWAATAVYSGLLCQLPDSHIERKYGNQFTEMVTSAMTVVDGMLLTTDRPEPMEGILYRIDADFKAAGINPGTTADMTVGTILAVELERLIGESVKVSKP